MPWHILICAIYLLPTLLDAESGTTVSPDQVCQTQSICTDSNECPANQHCREQKCNICPLGQPSDCEMIQCDGNRKSCPDTHTCINANTSQHQFSVCCKITGNWTDWGEWTGECHPEGGGKVFRYRECLSQNNVKMDKENCVGEIFEAKPCSNTMSKIRRANVNKVQGTKIRNITSYSMMISISTNVTDEGHPGTGHFCGGIILTDKYVLTAAHCPCGKVGDTCCDLEEGKKKFNSTRCNPANWKVTAGETQQNPKKLQGQVRGVTKIIIHRNYTKVNHEDIFDVALMRIDQPFNFSGVTIQPSWLPSSICSGLMDEECEEHLQLASEKQECEVVGWGSGTNLRTLTAVINNWDNETYLVNTTGFQRRQPCPGDSGGPLMCKPDNENFKVVVGIMSYLTLEFADRCNAKEGETIHSSIPHFLGWMHNQLIGRGDGNSNWDTQFSKYPWIASIWKNISYVGEPKGYACGGIIITDTIVLTSAYCLCLEENYCCDQNIFNYDKCDLNDWWVQVGQCKLEDPENPFLIRKISKIFIHELYDEFNIEEETRLNDIALIVLKDPLPLDDPDVDTARIPTSECTNSGATGESCTEHKLEDCEYASCGESPNGNGSSDKLKINGLNVTYVSESIINTESKAKAAPCK
ncbi:unnamed protein product, partial [Owenia fusiformis]